jgi:hypothetical protein
MGLRGREICEAHFSERIVIGEILGIYRHILSAASEQPSKHAAGIQE